MKDILFHIQSKINESQIINYPFPHLLISDFFPQDLYHQMLKGFPCIDGDSATNYVGADVNLQDNVWLRVRDDIYPKVLDMIEHKLAPLIASRIIELERYGYFLSLPNENFQTGIQLIQRRDNFYIEPHIHAPSEYLSILHYLPDDDSHALKGTQMYPVKKSFDMHIPWNTYPHVPQDYLGEPIIAPYMPNTAVIWVSTHKAIHGRTSTGIMRRYIYAYRLFNNECVDWSKGSLQVRVEA